MSEKPRKELRIPTGFADESALLKWVRHVHRADSLEFFDGAHEQSYIWLAGARGVKDAVLKLHKTQGAAHREVHAYQFIERHKIQGTPRLLARSDTDGRVLLLSRELGDPSQLDGDTAILAGQFLRAFHTAPYMDTDSMSLADAFQLRVDALRAQTRDPDHHGLLDLCKTRLTTSELGQRVLCHRDFRPGNWLSPLGGGSLTVLDFGHCRPGLWLTDLIHLRVMTLENPHVWTRFLVGYERTLNETEYNLLWALIGLYGVATCLRTDQGADVMVSRGQNYVDLGRQMLAGTNR